MPARAIVSPSTWTFTVIGWDEPEAAGAEDQVSRRLASSALLETASERAGIDDEARSAGGVLLGTASVSCCCTSVDSGWRASHW